VNPTIHRITLAVPALGLASVVLAFLLGDARVGIAASVGAVVALANWMSLRWLVGRATQGTVRSRNGLMVLLGAKMLLLGLVCWGLLARFGLEPFGFAIGLSSLVGGIFLGSVFVSSARPALGEES